MSIATSSIVLSTPKFNRELEKEEAANMRNFLQDAGLTQEQSMTFGSENEWFKH